jgi:hypothetical protein
VERRGYSQAAAQVHVDEACLAKTVLINANQTSIRVEVQVERNEVVKEESRGSLSIKKRRQR